MRRQDLKGFAVLCNGPAGECDAFFFQMLHDGLIAQRFARIFLFDERTNSLHDAFLGFALIVLGPDFE